jgi:hypothetical protein
MTLFGSITDSSGPIPADTPIEAYVGNKLCSKTGKKSTTMANGDQQLAVYVLDVYADEQFPGCGKVGSDVRVKVGDRFAPQTIKWNAGLAELDLAFNDAKPVVVPTATPTPTGSPTPNPREVSGTTNSSTPIPSGPNNSGGTNQQGGDQPTSSATVGTVPAGSPNAGSPAASPRGGLVTRPQDTGGTGSGSSSGGGDSFPVWAAVLLGLGGVALIGGGVGFAMSRNRRVASTHPDDPVAP